ncbi:MAG: AEC family transporter [Lachnospiraceae bacterium]|nr:AEC family transporter [Lachnospiraceae bacterium]
MDNLIYSLNATMPIFFVMVVGYVLRRIGMIDEIFVKEANKVCFKITLPCMLLLDMMECDIKKIFDAGYVLYCAVVTIVCILVIWVLAKIFFKDKTIVGEFVQGSYRGSAAILGVALVNNIIGKTSMTPLMMLGSIPLYNIFAVIVLVFESPDNSKNSGDKKDNIKKSFIGICKNPIILGILGGMILSLIDFKFMTIPYKTIKSIGSLTTPLALLCIGGGFEGRKAIKKIKPTVLATAIKLIIQPAVFLPIAVWLNFGPEKIVAVLIMLGAPTTATSYIMSKNMGHEGVLAASIVVLTTLLSAFTITFWVFVLRTFGII